MTTKAILEDGKVHSPVQLVLSGQLTIKQVDGTYKGARGMCPDCEKIRQDVDLSDGSSLALAIATSDRRVTYRCGCYAGEKVLRQMHFAHEKGYHEAQTAACRNLNQSIHRDVVDTIANDYRQRLGPEYVVEPECQFVKPGTPPETYRPDIVVQNAFGGPYLCIEYQRSPENFEHFTHRHELRASQWGRVVWFFDKRIYEWHPTKQARDWLFEHHQEFYVCWIDKDTGRLQAEPGIFSNLQKEKRRKPTGGVSERGCSIADIINSMEEPEGWQRTDGGVLVRERSPDKQAGIHFSEDFHKARAWQQKLYERIQAEREAEEARELRRQEREREEQRVRQALTQIDSTIAKLTRYGITEQSEVCIDSTEEFARQEVQRLAQILTTAEEQHEKERQRQEQQRREREEAIKQQMVAEIEELQQFVSNIRPEHTVKPSMYLPVDTLQVELNRLRLMKPRAEATYRQEAQKSLYQQVRDLIRQLEEDYGIWRVITTAKPTTPLERLQEEVEELQSRLERAERARKIAVVAEEVRARREAREKVKVDIERRRQELLAQNAQTPERRQELATLREVLAEALISDDSKLAIVALRGIDWVNDCEKRAWWDALPSGLQLWIREIHKGASILPLHFSGEIA